MPDAGFDYDRAFDRNIGWVSADEQQALRSKRIAIAGMGGVGGAHLLTLARMGIGAFSISDLDSFELANFNRQAGAAVSTLNRPKVEVMAEMAKDINPLLDIQSFPEGIDDGNIDAFLKGADLFVDGFDFFVPEIRAKVFGRCAELGIPAITAGPIGFGTSYIVFLPGRMTFEQYFRMEGQPKESQYARFLLGLTPSGLHRRYLVDPSRLNLVEKRGPSSAAAVQLCAGVVGVEAIKILLGRGKVRAAPYFHQFDVYRGKFVCQRLPFGNANPLQAIKLKVVEKHITATLALAAAQRSDLPEDAPEIEKILDLARWAPSGDNSQPWRFEILGDEELTVHLHDQSAWDIYDYDGGRPSLLSVGALLETIRIAASRFGRNVQWNYRGTAGPHHHLIDVTLHRAAGMEADPLLPAVKRRSVDRRRYSLAALSTAQKEALSAAVAPDFELQWFEGWRARWRFSRLNGRATDIRLRLYQAFEVHKKVIDWEHPLSPTGIPAGAIGLDRGTLAIMRWAMADWRRLDRLNRLLGTFSARLQLDYLPGLFCSAHFALKAREPLDEAAAILRAGEAIQKLWLTATEQGLVMQPGIAALLFAHHGTSDASRFPDDRRLSQALDLAKQLEGLTGNPTDQVVFLGRIGVSKRSGAMPRSVRKPLEDLLSAAQVEER